MTRTEGGRMQKITVEKFSLLPLHKTWWPIVGMTEAEAVKQFRARFPGFETTYFEVQKEFWFVMSHDEEGET